MSKEYKLDVETPRTQVAVVHDLPLVTVEQRERMQKATHYNEFAFPAGMLSADMLSDSGTTAMTDLQWAAEMLGDESYGRNKGYYCLIDAMRDVWERGDDQKRIIDLVLTGCKDTEKMMEEMYLPEYEGGLINGGAAQMERPNTFLLNQGRSAETVLFEIVKKVLNERHPGKAFTIPSNGHFDTTEGNIKQMGSIPRNLYDKEKFFEVPEGGVYKKNPFKGNMDTEKLQELIDKLGPENVPMIYLCITNNTVAGQPVSMANIRETAKIAHKYEIPLMFDVARWAENCYFIKTNEDGYEDKSIAEIAKEMFSYCDGLTASLKKDAHCNMGGVLAFRDKGYFWKKFSTFDENGKVLTDVGHLLKVKQISCYGNDSYGGISGHDIMACAVGLYECADFNYLDDRIKKVQYLAKGFYDAGLPVILPAGGHAVYIDMDRFFDNKRKPEDFAGAGFSAEIIRRYGIRISELGYFSFEYDLKTPEQQKETLNLVRFCENRGQVTRQQLDYCIAAAKALYEDRDSIPNMRITFGKNLPMRHFHAFLEPVPYEGK